MDTGRKRQILSAESRAEIISTLVGKGFYVFTLDEIERWHRDRGGAPDGPSDGVVAGSPAPRRGEADLPDRADTIAGNDLP